MRQHEFINEKIFRRTKSSASFKPDTTGAQQAKRFLGGGKFSNVYKSISDPHEVVKRNIFSSNLDNDAYYQYVRYIFNRINRNPYLPRVSRVLIRQDSQGRSRPEYRLERLQSRRNFDSQVIIGVVTRLFPNLESIIDRKLKEGEYRYLSSNEIATDVWGMLISAIKTLTGSVEQHYNQNFHAWARTQTRTGKSDPQLHLEFFTKVYPSQIRGFKSNVDPNLLEALSIIVHLQATNQNIGLDLHDANFMLRPTSVGPQLVFSDPLQTDDGRLTR